MFVETMKTVIISRWEICIETANTTNPEYNSRVLGRSINECISITIHTCTLLGGCGTFELLVLLWFSRNINTRKKIRLIWSQRYGNAKISHWRDEDISLWIESVDVCCISMFACFSFFISCVLMLLSFFFHRKNLFLWV